MLHNGSGYAQDRLRSRVLVDSRGGPALGDGRYGKEKKEKKRFRVGG